MPRITSDITEELKQEIQTMADDKKWSFSLMVSVLLQYAIREKHRKSKKNNTEHYSADPRTNNTGGQNIFQNTTK